MLFLGQYDGTILLMVINKVLPLALPAASSRRVRGYASSSRDVSCNWQCIGLACKVFDFYLSLGWSYKEEFECVSN